MRLTILQYDFPVTAFLSGCVNRMSRYYHVLALAFCVQLLFVAFLPAQDKTLSIDLGGGQVLELVQIPHGSFRQGSPESEEGREGDETLREVTLTKDFYLAKYPVTIGQFEQFVKANNYRTEAESGKSGGYGLVNGKLEQRPEFHWKNPGYPVTNTHPVTLVTVADVVSFNRWLANKTKLKIELPTEAQWEYACRAGTTTRFYSGDSDRDFESIGWDVRSAPNGPVEVGKKTPNDFGLFDMSGNVYEWCAEIYAPYDPGPISDPNVRKPVGNETLRAVLRGGSFTRYPKRCRSAARYRATPGTRNAENGFRIACISDEKDIEAFVLKTNVPQSTTPTTVPVLPVPTPNPSNVAQTSPIDLDQKLRQPEPHVANLEARPQSKAGLWVLLFILVLLLLMIGGYLLLVLMRATSRNNALGLSSPAGHDDRNLVESVEEDGFWLNTSGLARGDQLQFAMGKRDDVRYLYVTVESQPRQFVFTGSRPATFASSKIRTNLALLARREVPQIPLRHSNGEGGLKSSEPILG